MISCPHMVVACWRAKPSLLSSPHRAFLYSLHHAAKVRWSSAMAVPHQPDAGGDAGGVLSSQKQIKFTSESYVYVSWA